MRQILFRGKRADNGEWVEGFYYCRDWENTHWIRVRKDFHFIDIQVIGETVGQFTGLADKIGKKIFEGDILKSTFEYGDNIDVIIGVVEDDTCNPCFVIHHKFKGNGHDCYEYDFTQCGLRTNEVIGNIHDDPDLI